MAIVDSKLKCLARQSSILKALLHGIIGSDKNCRDTTTLINFPNISLAGPSKTLTSPVFQVFYWLSHATLVILFISRNTTGEIIFPAIKSCLLLWASIFEVVGYHGVALKQLQFDSWCNSTLMKLSISHGIFLFLRRLDIVIRFTPAPLNTSEKLSSPNPAFG